MMICYNNVRSLFTENRCTKAVPLIRIDAKIQKKFKNRRAIAELLSFGGGLLAGVFLETTGIETGLHEVVGHGLLGFSTIYQYRSGYGPTYWVQGWDNFKKIKDGGIGAFVCWILGIPAGQNGAAGWAQGSTGVSGVTSFGKAISWEGRSIWTSLSGSVPGLLLDGITAAVGAVLYGNRKYPKIGAALLGESTVTHLASSAYPIDAAVETPERAIKNLPGHDFANVALQLSHVTHTSAEAMAISIATIWTLSVPTLALLVFWSTRSQLINSISNTSAIIHWVKKASTDPDEFKRFNELQDLYHKKRRDPSFSREKHGDFWLCCINSCG